MVNIDMPAGVGAPPLDTSSESAVCNVELKLIVISGCFCVIPEYKSNMFVHFDHIHEYNSSIA